MQTANLSGVPVVIERFQASLTDADLATDQTLRAMCGIVASCARDSFLWAIAREALRTYSAFAGVGSGRPVDSVSAACDACWWWAKHHVKFKQDDTAILQLLNERYQLELLVTPSVLVRMRKPEEDCDGFTMLLASLLSILQIPWRVVVVAASPADPSQFSHVFLAAVLPDGSLHYLDASHGLYPGWHVPDAHVFRYRIYDQAGAVVDSRDISAGASDQAGGFAGLHGYVPATRTVRYQAAPRRAMPYYFYGRRSLRGLGCGCSQFDDSGCVDPDPCPGSSGGGLLLPPAGSGGGASGNDPNSFTLQFPFLSSSAAAAGSTNPGAWDKTVQQLLNSWTNIAGRVIAPTTSITNAKTGLSITTPAGSPSSSSLLSPSLFGSSSLGGSSVLWIAAAVVGIGLVLAVAKK